MNPDRWRQVGELVHEALGRSPDTREAFLDQACADDAQLRREAARSRR